MLSFPMNFLIKASYKRLFKKSKYTYTLNCTQKHQMNFMTSANKNKINTNHDNYNIQHYSSILFFSSKRIL